VYSLGVLLYELLVGALPFENKTLFAGGLGEIQRIIREVEPPKPSTRLSNLGDDSTTVAHQRHTEPKTLIRQLRGDLDWIVMKCLEKDRTRRYDTASGLALEVHRYLNNEPVLAGPPSGTYRLKKFVRRNKGAVAATATIFIALVVAFFGVYLGWSRASLSRNEAESARALAEDKADEALKSADLERAARLEATQWANELEKTLYRTNIALADTAYRDNNIGGMKEFLRTCPEAQRGWEWKYLVRRSDMSIRTLRGHKAEVKFVLVSSDGKNIVSIDVLGTAKIWNANTGEIISTFSRDHVTPLAASYTPQGLLLLHQPSPYEKGSPAALTVSEITSSRDISTLYGCSDLAFGGAISPDGKRALAACRHDAAIIWSVETGEKAFAVGSSSINNFSDGAFSPDSMRLTLNPLSFGATTINSTDDGQILVNLQERAVPIAVPSAQPPGDIATLKDQFVGAFGPRTCLAFSFDGNHVGAGSIDKVVDLWDAVTGEHIASLRGHSALVTSISFDQEGSRIVSVSKDGTVKLWDIPTGKELETLLGHEGGVTAVAMCPNGNCIVSGSEDKSVKLWNVHPEHDTIALPLHFGTKVSSDASSIQLDEIRLLGPGPLNRLGIVDVGTGEVIKSPPGALSPFDMVKSSLNGEWIVVAGYSAMEVWNAQTGKNIAAFDSGWFKKSPGRKPVAITNDGRRIVAMGTDSRLVVFDAQTGEKLLFLSGNAQKVDHFAFSNDSGRIASVNAETLMMWDAQTGAQLFSQPTQAGLRVRLLSLVFSADGARVACGSKSGAVKVWNAESGEELFSLQGHSDSVNSAKFSPDGRRLVSASSDGTLKVWDMNSGRELLTLRGHTGPVGAATWTGDGKRIISVSEDGTLRTWNASVDDATVAEILGNGANMLGNVP
jgi:WD40 repeat protein